MDVSIKLLQTPLPPPPKKNPKKHNQKQKQAETFSCLLYEIFTRSLHINQYQWTIKRIVN